MGKPKNGYRFAKQMNNLFDIYFTAGKDIPCIDHNLVINIRTTTEHEEDCTYLDIYTLHILY